MQNILSELIITVKNYINITPFKMKGSPDLGQADTVLQIKFEFPQFASIFVGVMPLLECRILKIHSFPHFSLTRFDILS